MTLLVQVVAQALSSSAAKRILFFICFIFFPFSVYTAVATPRRFLSQFLTLVRPVALTVCLLLTAAVFERHITVNGEDLSWG
jgi:hypothetical protein